MAEDAEQADTAAAESALASDPLAARVVTGLAKIGLATRHHAWAEGQGLTPTQGQILALLRSRGEGGMRLAAVADALAIRAPTATVAVQALERKGLVRKTRAADDARARAVTLTQEGEREAQRAAGWTDFLLGAVDTLSPGEQAVFLRGLVKMIRTLQERGDIPISRMCVTCRYFCPHVHPDQDTPHHCAFVDTAFGDRALRLDCADFEASPPEQGAGAWHRFLASDGVEGIEAYSPQTGSR